MFLLDQIYLFLYLLKYCDAGWLHVKKFDIRGSTVDIFWM